MTDNVLSRRSALRGALVVGVGGIAGFVFAHNSAAAKAKRGTTAANAYGPASSQGGKRLASVSQVPVRGGLVVGSAGLVLIRGQGDDVHAFSAVCTHQGCTVDRVAGGKIFCPCHGSSFDAATGAVTHGPASRPLATIPVVVREGTVYSS